MSSVAPIFVGFVKLFDDSNALRTFEQTDRAEKAAISHDANDFHRRIDVQQRIAVYEHDVGGGAGCDATELQAEAQRTGCIDPRCAKHLFVCQARRL